MPKGVGQSKIVAFFSAPLRPINRDSLFIMLKRRLRVMEVSLLNLAEGCERSRQFGSRPWGP